MHDILKFCVSVLFVAGLAIGSLMVSGIEVQAASSQEPEAKSGNANFEHGKTAFENGNWKDTVKYMKQAVKEDAKNADAFNLMGYSYRRMGDADQAFEAYGIALDLNPKHRGANEYLGQTYLLVGDLEKAELQLKRLVDLCGKQCRETVKLKKAIKRYKASADKQAMLSENNEDW